MPMTAQLPPAATSGTSPSPISVRPAQRLPIGPTPTSRPRSGSDGRPISETRTPSALPAHLRSPSSATSRSRVVSTASAVSAEPPPPLPSPSAASFAMSPPPGHGVGSTHAPGIQPPASFFRPVRPSQYHAPAPAPGPRPRSAGSSTHRVSNSFALESEDDAPPARRRAQKSREPLLPLERVASRPTSGGAVRVSLDRIFRRLSGSAVDAHDTTTDALPLPLALHPASPGTGRLEKHSEADERSAGQTSSRTSAAKRPRSSSLSRFGTRLFSPGTPAAAAAAVGPPLAKTPVLDAAGRPVRRWAVHPSANRFFGAGRMLTSGEPPYAFGGALALVLGIAGTWFGTTCVWWWLNLSPAVAVVGAYMCLLTLSTMLATAWRDPGILPRGLDLDPPFPSAASQATHPQPLPRDLRVRAGTVRVKWCPTCKLYRPPRSSHCRMCDNCVEGCDHHCQWVNNCVGHRNYTSFFAFLTSAVLTLLLVIVTSAIHLYELTRRDHISFGRALGRGAGSAVAFSLSVVVIWPLVGLAAYHTRLLLFNITTIEQIRNQAQKTLESELPLPPNPFTHGSWRRNLLNVLCRPAGYSWLDAHAIATEDRRMVNPAVQAN